MMDGTVVFGDAGQNKDARKMELPCGKCVGCQHDRARAWSIRIGHEAQLYDANCIVTLTYDEAHLPLSRSLEYPHFQAFMKRLREKMRGVSEGPEGGFPLRFFVAGEYGGQLKRPHWHAVLFNCRFSDAVKFGEYYLSYEIERLWQNGRCWVDPQVSAEGAAYVAGYTMAKKKRLRERPDQEDPYEDVVNPHTGELYRRRVEFCQMSLKPGIGAWWYRRYGRDLFPADRAVQQGKCYKVPRYYWNLYQDEADPAKVEEIAYARFQKAMYDPSESTPERRAVREEVAERRTKLFGERNSSL